MDLESEFPELEDSVTCVGSEYDDLTKEHGIKLKDGLYIQDLLDNKGVTFEPIEPPMHQEDFSSNSYFGEEDIVKYLNPSMCSGDTDSELEDEDLDDKTPFERLAIKMVDISGGDGGILKKVIKKGSGEIVAEGASVTIQYSAFLEYADEPYDSTYLRNAPLRIQLQSTNESCSLVLGLEIAIRTMCVNEMARFLVQSNYAYGSMGCPPRIPGDTVILFEVELLDTLDYGPAVAFDKLSLEDRRAARFEQVVAAAKAEQAAGNANFNKKSYNLAVKHYLKGTRMMEAASLRDQEDENIQQSLLLKLYCNLSLCYKEKHELVKVLTFCNKALDIQKDCTKAHYRRGWAKTLMGEYLAARTSLTCAKRLAPNDKHINDALLDLDKKESEQLEIEKILYRRMFQKPSSNVVSLEVPMVKESRAEDAQDATVDYERFRAYIRSVLTTFNNDTTVRQLTYPGELSFYELKALSEIAEDLGLDVDTGDRGKSVITINKVIKSEEL